MKTSTIKATANFHKKRSHDSRIRTEHNLAYDVTATDRGGMLVHGTGMRVMLLAKQPSFVDGKIQESYGNKTEFRIDFTQDDARKLGLDLLALSGSDGIDAPKLLKLIGNDAAWEFGMALLNACTADLKTKITE